MEQRQSDRIREKLYDLETPVSPEVWQGIEGSLRRRKLRRLFTYASSAAAVLVAALFILWPDGGAPEDTVQLTAQAVQVQDNLPDSDVMTGGSVPAGGNLQAEGDARDAARLRENAVQAAADMNAAAVLQAAEEHAGAVPAVAEAVQEKAGAAQAGYKDAVAGNAGQVQAVDDVAAKDAETAEAADRKAGGTVAAQLPGDGNYLASLEKEERNRGRGHSVSFSSGVIPGSSASVSGSTIKASSAGAGDISQSYHIEQISDTRYSLPLNLGIQFQFAIKENLAVGAGVNYTMLRSRYDCLINKKQFEVTQVLHYVGIPVNVYGLISERNRFSFYVNAGAMFEKGIRAVYDLKSYNQKEHSTSSIKGVDVSVNAGLGVEYRPGNLVGLYFEPNLVYFINSDMPRSIRTDQPLQVKAELGCRFHF